MEEFNIYANQENENIENAGFSVNTEIADSIVEKKKSDKANSESWFIETLEIVASAIITVVLIFCIFFRAATIQGPSMQKTLFGGDRVIISNFGYTPAQGDIVVISRNIENTVSSLGYSSEPIIKRIIAVGGQTVDIDFYKGIVYVDGIALKEPYISTPTVDQADVVFPIYIPEGYVFVLGDNRGDSLDSRDTRIGNNGIIDQRYILGKALFRFWPFDRIGSLY